MRSRSAQAMDFLRQSPGEWLPLYLIFPLVSTADYYRRQRMMRLTAAGLVERAGLEIKREGGCTYYRWPATTATEKSGAER